MTDYLNHIAKFAAEFQFESIPTAAIQRTKLIIADSIAAIVAGAAEPEISALTNRLSSSSKGESIVIGAGKTVDAGLAALLNGSSGTFLEQDEGNQFCKGHPGMHTIPATFSTSQTRRVSGSEFLTAITLGYELGARVGIATNLRSAMHPHGTWGVICAAVGVGRLIGFDTGQMKSLLNVASNLSLATSKQSMLEGGTVRNMYTGIAGQLGILACNLVETGFTGEHDGIANVFGNVVSDSFNVDAMTEQLGISWEVSRNYFKLHSCCRYNHAALDALATIIKQHPDDCKWADIERIDVDTYSLAAELNDQSPANTLAAKFSLPFAIATTLINNSSEFTSFTWEAVGNRSVQDFAKRVFVSEDPAMTARLPDDRPAHVSIKLHNGSILEAGTNTNRGDWRDPYTQSELQQKYNKLTSRLWNADNSAAVYQQIMALDKATSLDELTSCIIEADRPSNHIA